MRTNIEIDDQLMAEAMTVLGTTTKRETVAEALKAIIRMTRQQRALQQLRGIGWDGDLAEMRTSKYIPAE